MGKKSLRSIAEELGVSHSYLSQVIHGKRPASEKVLTNLLTNGLLQPDHLPYNESASQRSSGVEQRFRNSRAGVPNHPFTNKTVLMC